MSIPTIRQIFSNLATSVVLCSLTAQANAQSTVKAPALPEYCVRFDTNQTRNKYPYDKAMFQILRRLNAYSGWPDIVMKAKIHLGIEGLCPDNTTDQLIELNPENGSVAVGITDKNSGKNINPDMLAFMIYADQHPVTGMIVGNLTGLSSQFDGSFGEDDNESLNDYIVQMTAVRATIVSEEILLGAEMSSYYKEHGDLEFNMGRFSQLQNEIFILTFQSAAAATEKRRLSEEEKMTFRQAVFSSLLKNADLRTNFIKSWTQDHYNEMEDRAVKGLEVKTPIVQLFSFDEVKAKLARFPGNLAQTEFLRAEYETYWQSRATQDPTPFFMQILKIKSDSVNAAHRKSTTKSDPPPNLELNQNRPAP